MLADFDAHEKARISTPPATQEQETPPTAGISRGAPPPYSAGLQPYTPVIAPPPRQTKVALLVPLSGKNEPLGRAMANAAQLAVFDVGPGGFELMPRDSGGTSARAAAAAKEALSSGAQLVIGPLFATEVAAAKPAVLGSDVNMLALSTDMSLAEPGAYVMGFAPSPQVQRVVAYAVAQGIRRFAALVPSTPYGELVARALTHAAEEQGAAVVGMEKTENLAYLAAKKEFIEALLLPFGGDELRRIAGQVEKAGFEKDKIKLLGTGLWDEPGLADNQPFLIGGWYAAAEPSLRARFLETYRDTYGESPPRLATLAYDATALAAVLVRTGRGFERPALINPTGFAGLDGAFRLTAKGRIERGLAVSEVTADGSKVVHPAPKNFP